MFNLPRLVIKCLVTLVLPVISYYTVYGGQKTDSLLAELNKAIENSKLYDGAKLKEINNLRRSLKANTLTDRYDVYLKFYEAYKIFNFDSAFAYAKKVEELALYMNDPARIAGAKIKLSFILLSAGMFKETSDYLSEIDIKDQPDSFKSEYYSLMGRYYYDLAEYDNDKFHSPQYNNIGSRYMDSALMLFAGNSFEHFFYDGLKNLKQDNLEKAHADYQALYRIPDLPYHRLALVSSTLSIISLKKGEIDKAIDYQIKAAIADIKSSTKETFAIYDLAGLLYKKGNIENASLYIEKAIADASYYGARQRKVQISRIMPIIQSKKINYIESQRRLWIIYAAAVTILLALLCVLVVIIFKQVNKLKNAKRIITDAHASLRDMNLKLLESNKIKEEYIGYFLNVNSEYFQKIDKFKKSIEQKITDRKFDDLKFIVNNVNIKKEKEELLKSFDKVFLRLFPNFVKEFNALFKDDDQVKIKDNESLNTDLRIFALIRMGISENEKIAQILEYSVNTIYTYKTKIKNRSIVPKEDFEKRIMEIKSL